MLRHILYDPDVFLLSDWINVEWISSAVIGNFVCMGTVLTVIHTRSELTIWFLHFNPVFCSCHPQLMYYEILCICDRHEVFLLFL